MDDPGCVRRGRLRREDRLPAIRTRHVFSLHAHPVDAQHPEPPHERQRTVFRCLDSHFAHGAPGSAGRVELCKSGASALHRARSGKPSLSEGSQRGRGIPVVTRMPSSANHPNGAHRHIRTKVKIDLEKCGWRAGGKLTAKFVFAGYARAPRASAARSEQSGARYAESTVRSRVSIVTSRDSGAHLLSQSSRAHLQCGRCWGNLAWHVSCSGGKRK